MRSLRICRGGRRNTASSIVVVAGAVFAMPGSVVAQDEVILTSGDRVTGDVLSETDTEVVLKHPVLGELTIPRDTIGTITMDDVPPPPPPPAEPEKEWKGHIDISGDATFGNTDTQGFRVALTLVRETERMKTTLDTAYYLSLTNGDRETNRYTAGARNDWLFPESKWFYFAQGRYDWDEFQSWEHRMGGHGGLGYELIDEEDLSLNARGGLGATKEWGSEEEELRFEALAGLELAWTISEKQTLAFSTTIFPDLTNTGEFRWVNSADWSLLVDESSSMSLSAGVRHEYQSDIDPEFDKNDVYFFAGLQFDF